MTGLEPYILAGAGGWLLGGRNWEPRIIGAALIVLAVVIA